MLLLWSSLQSKTSSSCRCDPCRHGSAPAYLTDELCQLADVEARQRLRTSSSSSLIVNRTLLPTVGNRAFPVAAARVWNSLPDLVTSAPSGPGLKLTCLTFPSPVIVQCLRSDSSCFGHYNVLAYLLTATDFTRNQH